MSLVAGRCTVPATEAQTQVTRVLPGARKGCHGSVEAPVSTERQLAAEELTKHDTEPQGGLRVADPDVDTTALGAVPSPPGRFCHRTFRHVSKKHKQRYVDQFAGKSLIRNMDTRNQVAFVVGQMVGRRFQERDLVA